MARRKISEIAGTADLDSIEVEARQKTGLHSRGRRSFLANNDALKSAAEQGMAELRVSTDDCSLWPYNDRIYDGLSEENCKSLKDDIQLNGQLQPVVARRDPSGRKQYEIIIGTRRFWACQRIPGKQIKIALIEADDKQAYKIMRSENAERDDTTPYEKALNASRVIADIYQGSQKAYCLDNGIAEGTLSNWMAIVELDPEIKAAIPDMYALSANQAAKLRTVMNKKTAAKKAVLELARELKGCDFDTTTVIKKLIAAGEQAAKPKLRRAIEKTVAVAGDKQGMVIKRSASGAVTIKLSKAAAQDKAAVIKALGKHLDLG